MVELTFTVHPRPTSDCPLPDDKVAMIAALKPREPIEEPEDIFRYKDTLLGELVFLMRFAFGRY